MCRNIDHFTTTLSTIIVRKSVRQYSIDKRRLSEYGKMLPSVVVVVEHRLELVKADHVPTYRKEQQYAYALISICNEKVLRSKKRTHFIHARDGAWKTGLVEEANIYLCSCLGLIVIFFLAFPGGDHCSLGHDCHGDAKCVNGLFSYTCHCNEGFIGDGRNSCQGKMILKETEFLYWL